MGPGSTKNSGTELMLLCSLEDAANLDTSPAGKMCEMSENQLEDRNVEGTWVDDMTFEVGTADGPQQVRIMSVV